MNLKDLQLSMFLLKKKETQIVEILFLFINN